MKPLRSLLDRLHPLFEKDGKLARFYPLYEGIDTFLYTPGETTTGPSHVRDGMDLKRMMITVVVALIPCIFMAMYNTGYQANRVVKASYEAQNKELIAQLKRTGATISDTEEAALLEKAGLSSAGRALIEGRFSKQSDIAAAKSAMQKVRLLSVLGGLVEARVITKTELDAIASGEADIKAAVLDLAPEGDENNAKRERIEAQLAIADQVEATRASLIGESLNPDDLPWRNSIMKAAGGYDPSSLVLNVLHGALYFFPIFLVCNVVGGTWELIFCCIRGHDLNEGFLVTGMLFPLTLPPTIPLWQVAAGISFGVVIGKEVFGGTGKNFLNPALTARAFLYFAYPAQILGDKVWTAVDGYTGATTLTQLGSIDPAVNVDFAKFMSADMGISWNQAFLGFIPGSMGETSTLACLLGALLLVWSGVGSWRIMVAVLLGAMGTAGFLNSFAATAESHLFKMGPEWHLVTGGLAFGLVFMATDPVSAAMTNTGKWLYGLLIGFMTILIRVVNPAFPEGIMLAILLGNVFAPLLDYFVVQANIKRRLARSV